MSTRPIPPPLASSPPEAWPLLVQLAEKVRRPLERFLHIEAASGILLMAAAVLSLGWANSPWRHSYHAFWRTPIAVRAGSFAFERSLE